MKHVDKIDSPTYFSRFFGPGPELIRGLFLLALTGLGALFRFFQIGRKGMWLDETFSVWLGWHSLPEMLSWIIRIDQHPPLYYTLLHFWLKLGDSAGMARSLSALAGVLTIPVIYFIGRQLLGPRVGLLAAFILTISPFNIRFAQETRMYTWLTLNGALALLALVHLLTDPAVGQERPGGRLFGAIMERCTLRYLRTQDAAFHKGQMASQPSQTIKNLTDFQNLTGLSLAKLKTDLAWLGYLLFTTATMLSHNTALLFPVATNLFVFSLILWRHWERPQGFQKPLGSPSETLYAPSLKGWLWVQLGILLLWSPWLIPFIIQAVGVYREFWISAPSLGTVLGAATNLLSVYLPGQVPRRFEWTDGAWLGFGLIIAWGFYRLRRRPSVLLLLLTLFLTPFVGEWLVSLRRPIFYDKTLIWSCLPLYLLLATGLAGLRYRPLILAGLLAVVAFNILSLGVYYFKVQKEDWDQAAVYVAEEVEPGDLLLFNATWVQIPFDFYFRHFDRPVIKRGVPADLFELGLLEPKMSREDIPRLRRLIRPHARVWLIYSHDWYTDPDGLIPATLAGELRLLRRQRFVGVEVLSYERGE